MKIEHELADVQIVRYPTIARALEAGFSRFAGSKARTKFVLSTLHLDTRTKVQFEAERELDEMLAQPLGLQSENEGYRRTLALVTFAGEMEVQEFFRKLAQNYYPASISEGMAYLPILASKGIVVDTVFHLGASLRNEKYREFRLLTRSKGEAELVPFYDKTKLKQYYHIVVVKKEKENQIK